MSKLNWIEVDRRYIETYHFICPECGTDNTYEKYTGRADCSTCPESYVTTVKVESELFSKRGHLQSQEVLRFIVEYEARNGIMPTRREIVKAMRFGSTSVAHYHIAQLVKAGILEQMPEKARGLRFSDAFREQWKNTS